jgi:hypothetical protein
MQSSYGTEEDNWAAFRDKVWETACAVAKLDAQAQAIPVHKFCASYLSTLNEKSSEIDQICLSVIFSDHGEEEEEFPLVTKKQFDLFLKRFGPPERSLVKIRDVLQNGKKWFHGKQSRQASERLLVETGKEGDFLMRYSSVEGAFTVDYIKRNKICHFNNIRNDPSGGVCVLVGKTPDQQKSYKFTSMNAFITKNEHIFVNPCLNPRSHFQWLKLRIPDSNENSGVGSKKLSANDNDEEEDETDDDEDDDDEENEDPAESKIPTEERVKNAIQNAFQKNKAQLSLKNLGIGPQLPLHICRLNYVVYLDLSKNKLTELPEDLQALRLLKRLNVSSNRLTTLPGVIFASFPRLSSFICAENQITEIPDGLFKATTLTYLDFSANKLTRLPVQINALEQLGFLELSQNNIELLPQMDKLDKLEEFYVAKNKLRELPGSLASLQALTMIDASDNQITHIAKELLSLMAENNSFGLQVDGNPLCEEDAKQIAALLTKTRSRAESRSKKAQDILGVIQMSDRKQWMEEPAAGAAPGGRVGTSAEAQRDKRRESTLDVSEQDREGGLNAKSNSLWLPAFGFNNEEGKGKKVKVFTLQEHINIFDYRRYFYHQTVHANIIGNDKQLGPICISIQKEPTMSSQSDTGIEPVPVYRVLLRTKQYDRRLEVKASEVKLRKKEKYARSDDLLVALKKLLQPFSPRHLWVIRDKRSHREFAELEDKLKSNSSKFGIIYGKDGQDETQMYNNVDGSEEFEDFLTLLGGERINMKGWDKYRGDFSNKADQKSLYTCFRDHEIMFHVMTYLMHMKTTDQYGQQWERKRFIGNDIVVIVFYEGRTPLDPNIFVSNFNHVFALVVPEKRGDKMFYQLHMTYKVGVAESKPPMPEDNMWEHGPEFREFLLTKLINAERCAMSATQFRRPQEKVRAELFQSLQQKFPKRSSRGLTRSRSTDTDRSQVLPEYLDPDTADAIQKYKDKGKDKTDS